MKPAQRFLITVLALFLVVGTFVIVSASTQQRSDALVRVADEPTIVEETTTTTEVPTTTVAETTTTTEVATTTVAPALAAEGVSEPLIIECYDDDDSVPLAIEDSYAGGDGNGDGIPDSCQNNVATIANPVSGAYITLEVDEDFLITYLSVNPEPSQSAQDAPYDYALGLIDFTIECGRGECDWEDDEWNIPQGIDKFPIDFECSSNVTIYFDKQYDTSAWHLRKLVNGVYEDIEATYATATVDGDLVTKVSYIVTDGGVLDADGEVNGEISDPVGAATAVVVPTTVPVSVLGTTVVVAAASVQGTLPATGNSSTELGYLALTLIALGIALAFRSRRQGLLGA